MNGVYKKIERIKKALDKIERNKYSDLSLDYCCDYICWVAKYKKAPENVWAPICEKITKLYKNSL